MNSPKKISPKTSLIKNYVISYEALNNVQNENINKYSACIRRNLFPIVKTENNKTKIRENEGKTVNESTNEKIKEKERELIVHNVFLNGLWTM